MTLQQDAFDRYFSFDALSVAAGLPPAVHSTFGEDTARARRTDADTSHEAADVNDVHTSIGAVLDCLREEGPMIDERIEVRLSELGYKFTGQRLRTAREALVKKGLVRHNGQYRNTSRGRRSQVWGVVAKAAEPTPDWRECGACDREQVAEIDRWRAPSGLLVEEWKCADCGHWNSVEMDPDEFSDPDAREGH